MSKSVNQVILIGNVGKSPEVRNLNSEIKVATFTLATSSGGYKKQDGSEVPEKTQWHNIVAWRNLAEIAEKYIHKGDKVAITGAIAYREYVDANNVKKIITDIVANDICLMSKPSNTLPPLTTADIPENYPTSNEQKTYTNTPITPQEKIDDLPY